MADGGGVIKVLVVDDMPAVRASLKEMLTLEPDIAVVGEAGDGEEAVRRARELRPDVILMDVNLPRQDGLAATAQVRRELPSQVVVISVEHSPEYFRRAMQVGARDYLVKPFGATELIAAVRSAVAGSGMPPTAPAPRGRGRVVTVFAAKGGVGKTLVAVNLAVALSLRPQERTVLVDLDLETGAVTSFLHLRPRASLADLARLPGPLDPSKVDLALTRVPGMDLAVLAAPPSPHLAAEVEGQLEPQAVGEGGARVGEVLGALVEAYDWVVVDTAANFRDSNLQAFDRSDLLLLLTTPDIPALANTSRCWELLVERLGYPRDRVRVALNRRDPVAQLGRDEIAEALGQPVAWELPHDAVAAVTSANAGQPLCGRRGKSPLSEALGRLAVRIGDELRPSLGAAAAAGTAGAVPAASRAGNGRALSLAPRREGRVWAR